MLSCRHAALARAVGARREPAAAEQPAAPAGGAQARLGCALLRDDARSCRNAHACTSQESISDLRQYSLTEEELARRRGRRYALRRDAESPQLSLRCADGPASSAAGRAPRAPRAQRDCGISSRCAARGGCRDCSARAAQLSRRRSNPALR